MGVKEEGEGTQAAELRQSGRRAKPGSRSTAPTYDWCTRVRRVGRACPQRQRDDGQLLAAC